MEVPILKQGPFLIASIQSALSDADLLQLRDALVEQVGRYRSRGVIVDVTALDVVDSFASLTIRQIAQMIQLRGATTVIVGIQPEVAFSMVQLGLTLQNVVTRKIEKRIELIEDLRKNQLSPVVVLDVLATAIHRTKYVWLSNLSQNNTTISMAGTGTSVDTLSDFVANLKSTGYFRNINLARFDDAKGNYTFSLTCEFSPPSLRITEKGAN